MFNKTVCPANHARVMRFWLKTERFWKDPGNQDKQANRIKFQDAMIAALSAHVTDVEWDLALQVAEDTLRIAGLQKGEVKNGKTETRGTSGGENPSE